MPRLPAHKCKIVKMAPAAITVLTTPRWEVEALQTECKVLSVGQIRPRPGGSHQLLNPATPTSAHASAAATTPGAFSSTRCTGALAPRKMLHTRRPDWQPCADCATRHTGVPDTDCHSLRRSRRREIGQRAEVGNGVGALELSDCSIVRLTTCARLVLGALMAAVQGIKESDGSRWDTWEVKEPELKLIRHVKGCREADWQTSCQCTCRD